MVRTIPGRESMKALELRQGNLPTKVLQRIYLFSDSQGDVDPEDVIDLKDVAVAALAEASSHLNCPDARVERLFHNLVGELQSLKSPAGTMAKQKAVDVLLSFSWHAVLRSTRRVNPPL